ncbi:PREDICTED: serine/threonine-protein kinase Chk1-like isoform X2 [Priapulus caudatus]|uniref:non-specific serine/threonine protein kinase n=1 Tax=Priapulus caudatus TaxID=37621 RepID=A0ABM1E711_PRICU|nr:PREDICTED: serine/threonine-protein kinase Chk1-like isoform X2 [Priapulus caudatus]
MATQIGTEAEEFVEGWDFIQTLGEGAYGEVKLVVNRMTQEAVAVKIIDLSKYPAAKNDIRKEIAVHRLLKHKNIIQFFGNRVEGKLHYIFLEYAAGGELFDRIEPDIGMPQPDAQLYFRQLVEGMAYLHKLGVTHRDVKPENLLLDTDDTLKITDFGLATVFRYQGKERQLNKRCGTLPYVAPEVISAKEYKAEPADIWSCGVVLVALLAGELPWDQPHYDNKEYYDWKECNITLTPWSKINNLALSLLRKILLPNVEKRASIEQIQNHVWFTKKFNKDVSNLSSTIATSKRKCSNLNLSPSPTKEYSTGMSASQPLWHGSGADIDHKPVLEGLLHGACFSQPVHKADDILISTQMHGTQGNSQTLLQKLVKRMTRFIVTTAADETIDRLTTVLKDMPGYSYKHNSLGEVTITTRDRRNVPLVFKAHLLDMNSNILLDFRLSKGDGIEFKRHFLKIKRKLTAIVNVKAPITWPSPAVSSPMLSTT